MPIDNPHDQLVSDEVLAARTGQADILGKLDDELPSLRFNGDAKIELERLWRPAGCSSLSEYIRLVLYANVFGAEHIANLRANQIWRVVGNAATAPRKGDAA